MILNIIKILIINRGIQINIKYYHITLFIFFFILITDLLSILKIDSIAPVFIFILLTLIPGFLIIQILKLNKLDKTEIIILSVGLSASFLMIFGLLLNFFPIINPLSKNNILIGLNFVLILLLLLNYKFSKVADFKLNKPNLNLAEKVFLFPPFLFLFLSVFGAYLLQNTNNNILLLFLLFMIPIYIIFFIYFNNKIPKRIYPIVLYFIGLSVLLIFMMRFSHIVGKDVNLEYYIFQVTLTNFKWSIILNKPVDACLSISIFPTIFQSLMNVYNQELLFKWIYVFFYSFIPLVIFTITKKYLNNKYAFLAAFFFMSQLTFIRTAASARTSMAILFIGLFIMVLLNDKINLMKKRIILIIFLLSCIFSHYTSAYILFIILLSTWIIHTIALRNLNLKNSVLTISLALLFFISGFFWYSQITTDAFDSGALFLKNVFFNLNDLFIGELKESSISQIAGQGLQNALISKINLIILWSTFVFIGSGVLFSVIKYKSMVISNNFDFKRPEFLKKKFEADYLIMAIVCVCILVATITLPLVSVSYDMYRTYSLTLVVLSPFLIVGGIILSKKLYLNPTLVILLVILSNFLFVSGAVQQISGIQYDTTLNSNGTAFDQMNVMDSDVSIAGWIGKYSYKKSFFVIQPRDKNILISQGKVFPGDIILFSGETRHFIQKHDIYYILFDGDLYNVKNITYGNYIGNNSEIYDNGNSEISMRE